MPLYKTPTRIPGGRAPWRGEDAYQGQMGEYERRIGIEQAKANSHKFQLNDTINDTAATTSVAQDSPIPFSFEKGLGFNLVLDEGLITLPANSWWRVTATVAHSTGVQKTFTIYQDGVATGPSIFASSSASGTLTTLIEPSNKTRVLELRLVDTGPVSVFDAYTVLVLDEVK